MDGRHGHSSCVSDGHIFFIKKSYRNLEAVVYCTFMYYKYIYIIWIRHTYIHSFLPSSSLLSGRRREKIYILPRKGRPSTQQSKKMGSLKGKKLSSFFYPIPFFTNEHIFNVIIHKWLLDKKRVFQDISVFRLSKKRSAPLSVRPRKTMMLITDRQRNGLNRYIYNGTLHICTYMYVCLSRNIMHKKYFKRRSFSLLVRWFLCCLPECLLCLQNMYVFQIGVKQLSFFFLFFFVIIIFSISFHFDSVYRAYR